MPEGKPNAHHTRLLFGCSLVGLLGCAAVVAADLLGIAVVEKHDPISETISNLAAGRYGWIQDTGLVCFAAGTLAIAVALFAWNFGHARWNAAAFLLVLLAIDTLLIAYYNRHAGENTPSGTAHQYATYGLFALVVLAPWLIAADLRTLSFVWYGYSIATSLLWLILGPTFMYLVPTTWDGALERFLGTVLVLWLAMLSTVVLQRSRLALPDSAPPAPGVA